MAVYFQKREIVVPGQLLAEGRYRGSAGTYGKDDKIFSSVVGLAELRGNTVKVVPLQGVYIPREGDLVIGTITIVAGNNWKVDIGGPYGASLHANNALRRPYDDDISRYMDAGDVIIAEVIAFDRSGGPFLTMKGRGLRRLDGGMILHVSPAKIPRVIGRRGSMINMIKDLLRIQTVVGQNGRIWVRARDPEIIKLAIKAFKMIESEAHTSKLTDRVHEMLREELASMKGVDMSEDDDSEEEDLEEDIDSEESSETDEEPKGEAEPEVELEKEPGKDAEAEPEAKTEEDDTKIEESESSEKDEKEDGVSEKPADTENEDKEVSE